MKAKGNSIVKHERQKRAKHRAKSIYDEFARSTVALFRKKSLVVDLFIGETSGHRGDDVDVGDLISIIGARGILKTVADTLHLCEIDGVNIHKVCGDIYDDLYEFEKTDEYYWNNADTVTVENMTELVGRTIKHLHVALDAYALLEKSRGHRIADGPDDEINPSVKNPTLLRLQIARTTHNYNARQCEYIHAGYSTSRP